MTKKEIIEYLKQNMPEFTGDRIEKEKKIAMYIYLELGKMKVFDEKYFFGNAETQEKIRRLSQRAKYNIEPIAENRKVVCITLSYLYKKILKEFGINCSISIPSDGDKHVFPIINFSNGQSIIADLQQDLHNIQTRSRTEHFGHAWEENGEDLSEDEIFNIQKEIGYVKDESDYMNAKIEKLAKEVDGLQPDETLNRILNDNDVNAVLPDLGYIELYQYYKSLIFQTAEKYDRSKINYFNCYRYIGDSGEKEYCMCIYSVYKDKVDAYLSSTKSNKFLPVTLEKLDELEHKGLFLGATQKENGVKLLRRYINKDKQKRFMEKLQLDSKKSERE